MKTTIKLAWAVIFTGMVAGCSGFGWNDTPENTAQPATTKQSFAKLKLGPGERRFHVDSRDSLILIYTYRGGRLKKLGHSHVIAARSMEGSAAVTPNVVGTRLQLRIALHELSVDERPLRTAAGPEFSSKPSPEDVAATRNNMLSMAGLNAGQHPHAIISGVISQRNERGVTVAVRLSLNGATAHITVAGVSLTQRENVWRLKGRTTVKQSMLGIEPFSALAGALIVLDEVTIDFDVAARLGITQTES
ncbi:MAG: YceI family protein [Chromatiales bacterium]|nr:YceI family protein [Chromatiales bacterium]